MNIGTLERNIPSVESLPPTIALYESYRSRKGGLRREAYKDAVRRVVKIFDYSIPINPLYIRQAQLIVKFSNIKLSPEMNALELYAVLRGDTDKEKKYTSMGDQRLLAEVLYHQKEYDALEGLIKAYPDIFKLN